MKTWGFSGGILSTTVPTTHCSPGPDGQTADMYKDADSSWDHFNHRNLSRDIFSLKPKATMFRISLQYSQDNLLRTAGEAILGTNFSVPGLWFVSCWGCKVAAEEQQLVTVLFPKFQKTDLENAVSPAPNNCTSTISCWNLPRKLRTRIPYVYKIHMTDFKLKKDAFTLSITYLVPCHIKQYSLKLCCQKQFRNMHSPQCILRIQNGAFKNASAFFLGFLLSSKTSLTTWGTPLAQHQSKWKKVFPCLILTGFHLWLQMELKQAHHLLLCVHRLLPPPALTFCKCDPKWPFSIIAALNAVF